MSEEEKEIYANWLLNECETPIDEIILLLDNLTEDFKSIMWYPSKIEKDE